MGVGPAIFWATVGFGVLLLSGVWVWSVRDRRKPRDLSDVLAERIRQTATDDAAGIDWAGLDRDVLNWPEHDGVDERCWCRRCYDREVGRLVDAEIYHLFAGLVDTPELRELADRARRGIR